MGQFMRCIKGEFLKMRHTSFYVLHICLPLLGAVLFLVYYRLSSWEWSGKLQGYLEALSVIFPFLGAIMTAMAAEQEADAGNFQELLAVSWPKACALGGKLAMLLVNALAASGIAVWTFYLGFYYILGERELGAGFYLVQWLLIFAGQAGLYTLHLLIGIQWGKNACIGAGVVETLLAALLLTGLGDGLWFLVPPAFAGHFSGYGLLTALGASVPQTAPAQAGIAVLLTLVLGAGVFIWFGRFQGRSSR